MKRWNEQRTVGQPRIEAMDLITRLNVLPNMPPQIPLTQFGLDVIDTLEPKPGIPPSPTHLAELIPKMKAEGVRLIIAEPNRER